MTDIRSLVVDYETGEINNLVKHSEILRIYKTKNTKTAGETDENVFSSLENWQFQSFFKGHLKELRMVMEELSAFERAFLISVAPYVGYEDCCLKYDNGNELSFDDMVRITRMSRSSVLKIINSLLEKDIIYRGKNSGSIQYFMNPWLFSKGNRINKVLKTMFRNYPVRVHGNKKWGNL